MSISHTDPQNTVVALQTATTYSLSITVTGCSDPFTFALSYAGGALTQLGSSTSC